MLLRGGLKMEKRKTRGVGIRSKILFPTSLVIILMCAVMGINSYRHIKEGLVVMGVEGGTDGGCNIRKSY